jgi:hypothetical protein
MNDTRQQVYEMRTIACAKERHDECLGTVYARELAGERYPWKERGACTCDCHKGHK